MEVAAAAMIGGTALSAYGQYEAGQNAKKIGLQNQALANQTAYENQLIGIANKREADIAASDLEKTALYNQTLLRENVGKQQAEARAAEGNSGFKYEGTPEVVARVSQQNLDRDVATIWTNAVKEADTMRRRGTIAATQSEYAARNMIMQGDIQAQAGTYAEQAGYINMAGTLLSGSTNAYMTYKYPNLINARFRTA